MESLGRYQIQQELGRGAMGTVYRAYDPKIDRVVALKTITLSGIDAAGEADFRRRFVREAQAAGKLSHPGIVTIHDVGEDETSRTPFIVMEYIEGTTLEELGRGERLPLARALELAEQVAEALDYAHERGIVHRDIKPANIIITPDGRAKITDFGIAKLQQTDFTQSGQVLGTPTYMSPEQLTGGAVDGRSDLFSLGAVLYWMLTGQKPFTGDSITSVSFKVAYQEPLPPSQVSPGLSPEFNWVVERTMAKDPAQRYQRGRELAADLEDLQQGRRPRSQSSGTIKLEPIEKTVVCPASALKAASLPVITPAESPLVAAWRRGVDSAKRLPRVAQAALGATVVLLGVLVFLSQGPAASATMVIKCFHSFREAELSVWVGDDRVHAGTLSGVMTKEWGVFETVRGSFSETLRVPAGNHLVRVRVSAPAEGYEQTKEIQGEFVKDGQQTLVISFGRKGRDLRLSWE